MNETPIMKITILKGMDDYIRNNADDDFFYNDWLANGVPDACDDEMYEFIATNEECWKSTVDSFARFYKTIS